MSKAEAEAIKFLAEFDKLDEDSADWQALSEEAVSIIKKLLNIK